MSRRCPSWAATFGRTEHEGGAQGANLACRRARGLGGGHRAPDAARARPRVLAYDPTGYARLIQPEARGHAAILELAEEMVRCGGDTDPPTRRAGAGGRSATPATANDTGGAGTGGAGAPPGARARRRLRRALRGVASRLRAGEVARRRPGGASAGGGRGACVRVVQRRLHLLRARGRSGRARSDAGGRLRGPGCPGRRAPAGRARRGHARERTSSFARARAGGPHGRPACSGRARSGPVRPGRRSPRSGWVTPSRGARSRYSTRRAARSPTTARACVSAPRSWRVAANGWRRARTPAAGHAGFELLEQDPEDVAGLAARRALTLLDAVDAPTGRLPVVVGNGFGGVLLHEAVGHGLEVTQSEGSERVRRTHRRGSAPPS